MKKKTIVLIDGNYCLYQTYFSFLKLKNHYGHFTGILYGYIKIFNKIVKKFYPDNIVVVFDTPTKTFRHQLYSKYKKNRSSMPENLKKQINPLKEIIQNLGIPIISINNIEADDIIGTLSKKFIKKKYYIFIYSADKDMLQLINKKIKVIPGKNIENTLNEKEVYKKYGIQPYSIADFLGLTGDTSDNIPGIPGIGKKTASILLKNFLSIDNIYKNIENISLLPIKNIKKITDNLKKNKDLAFLSLSLTKINKSVLLNYSTNDLLKKNKPNIPFLLKKFQYYQFNEYIKQIYNNMFPVIDIYHKKEDIKKKKKYIEIIDNMLLTKLINKINKKKIFSIAVNLYNKKKKNIFSISITIEKNTTWWFNSNQNNKKNTKITIEFILKNIKPILENKKYKKIGKNLKNIFHIFKKYNITLNGMYFDISIIYYNCKLSNYNNNYYKYLIKKYSKKKINITEEKKINEIIQESLISLKIYNKTKIYFKIYSIKEIFQSIDMPLLKVLSIIENNGVLIKKKILKKQKVQITNTINKLKKKIYHSTKEKFNINSPKQLISILFKKYNFLYIKKTKKGNVSINEKILHELSKNHKLPKIILQYRFLKKIKNTYLNNLINSINRKTNRIHTTYHQTSTLTGRLSSSNPNLQNIPIKNKLGRKIRIAFIAKKKWILLAADYSHIELRIIAHYSQDKKLIQDLSYNNDIYIKIAAHIFMIKDKKVKSYQRNIAKIVIFSILYGISPFGLSQKLNIPVKKASEYINNYFARYKETKKYIKNIYHIAKKNEYIKTLFGRKLYISNINSSNNILKKKAKRFCINTMIQNTASDIIKKSMIKLNSIFQKKFKNEAKIIMQIHDELIFEIKENKKNILTNIIKNCMENNVSLKIPLYVSIKTGKNWKEISK
ncbi:DNA polymerase I [Buchnera aphidicola]|uniref:DNA polymerase I n=1 Tax=Buchnera aphidicola TaxID=9 RepID=UPI00107BE4C5|nr:DNA polymerase I [Buchnera aphidicola]VFP79276.1 DNA polymerase I [Buchnera aphidicola (Cinara curtihirsuta)]